MVEVFPDWPHPSTYGILFFVDKATAVKRSSNNQAYPNNTPIFARAIIPGVDLPEDTRNITPEQHVRVVLSWVNDGHHLGMTANVTHDMWVVAKEMNDDPIEQD